MSPSGDANNCFMSDINVTPFVDVMLVLLIIFMVTAPMMMREALKICNEKGCYKAVVSSNLKRKRAHAFYESLGFKRHGYSYYVAILCTLS